MYTYIAHTQMQHHHDHSKPTTNTMHRALTLIFPNHSLSNTHIRREILPNRQVLKPLLVLNHQPLLIRQMQQANEAETR
jgi:hypothetical protein